MSFIALEARSYSGGRTCAFKPGHESAGECVLDRGSNWVQSTGAMEGDTTPSRALRSSLLDMDDYVIVDPPAKARLTARCYEQELAEQVVYIFGATDDNVSNHFKVFDKYRQDGDPTGNLRGTCNDAMDEFNRTDYDWVFDNNMEWVIEREIVDNTTDVSVEDTALLGLGSDPLYPWWGPDYWFVSEQRSQAFASWIDLMACGTAPEKDARIILNAYDKNISWSDCWVVGSTHGDREWSAKPTILTIPCGVFQSHHHTPSVPHIHSEQQPAQVGDLQSARHFTSWHNMSNSMRILDSNMLFTLLG